MCGPRGAWTSAHSRHPTNCTLQARVRELETQNALMQRELDHMSEVAQRHSQQLRWAGWGAAACLAGAQYSISACPGAHGGCTCWAQARMPNHCASHWQARKALEGRVARQLCDPT